MQLKVLVIGWVTITVRCWDNFSNQAALLTLLVSLWRLFICYHWCWYMHISSSEKIHPSSSAQFISAIFGFWLDAFYLIYIAWSFCEFYFSLHMWGINIIVQRLGFFSANQKKTQCWIYVFLTSSPKPQHYELRSGNRKWFKRCIWNQESTK